jgi:hypothetical protein
MKKLLHCSRNNYLQFTELVGCFIPGTFDSLVDKRNRLEESSALDLIHTHVSDHLLYISCSECYLSTTYNLLRPVYLIPDQATIANTLTNAFFDPLFREAAT